ncbi:GNAT family N-acetyltransferase [Sporosarcina sp. Te-1]|uniref:GNAT family N-acetyltransferase n=1 Tax=Sporosarcina sp. Te-1 TaxID=2818390 RepID=UPI001A9D55EC|nr:GNAT family N-acetyltransferase [Sporosarcina sp. Te-1]QTD41259.1 GNAT family N-acetyltransferase [Sporosarcina sp. Te-1]
MKRQLTLKNGQIVEIRPVGLEQLKEILSLQQKVFSTLSTKTFLQPLTEEEFAYILGGKGVMLGVYLRGELIAFRAMMEPDELDDEHLGLDAGLTKEEFSTVLYSEITNVHPDYRGNSLQRILGRMLLAEIDQEKYRYICTTVAPFNIASLKDKFNLGMHIVALKEKYGTKLRYILMKDLTARPVYRAASVFIHMGNTERQQELLEKGWVGVGMVMEEDEWKVEYRKF